jgi:hypothetical protein
MDAPAAAKGPPPAPGVILPLTSGLLPVMSGSLLVFRHYSNCDLRLFQKLKFWNSLKFVLKSGGIRCCAPDRALNLIRNPASLFVSGRILPPDASAGLKRFLRNLKH